MYARRGVCTVGGKKKEEKKEAEFGRHGSRFSFSKALPEGGGGTFYDR